MIGVRALSFVGLVATVSLTAVAGAAGNTWTSPDTLSSEPAAGTPTLAFDARGWALATWARSIGGPRRSASRPQSATAFRPERAAPNIGEQVADVEGSPPAPVVDGSGDVIAIQQRKIRPACGIAVIFTLTPRFGRVNGTFRRARRRWTVFSPTQPPAVALAGNARGMAVVAWVERQRDARGRCLRRLMLRIAVRRPGRGFGTPMTLSRSAKPLTIAAAVGRRGHILVAWRRGQKIVTRSRAPHGRWGPVQPVTAGRVDSLAATVAPDGAAYLVWTRLQATPAPENPRIIGAAARRPHSRRFASTILERGTWPDTLIDRPERRAVRLRALRRGALAAWTSWDTDHLRVLTATAAGGRFAIRRLATPAGQGFALGDLATSAAGRVAIALTSNADETPSRPFVALGAANGAFGAPEAIGSATAGVDGEALAFSPRTGQPTLVWTGGGVALVSTRR